jgi:NitT/TauT family transport system substrate-binding protein
MVAPLSTGQLDAGGGQVGTALFNAVHQGLDMKAVCAQGGSVAGISGTPTLVRIDLFESGEVTEAADLQGKKLGVNLPRGMAEYNFAKLLEEAGLTIDDAEMVAMPFPEMPAAFANAAIDLAHLPFPLAGKAIGEGSAVVFREGYDIAGDIQTAVIYFGKRFLEPENKEVAVRFLTVWLQGVRDLQESNWSNEEDIAIIAEYTNLPPEVIKTSPKSYYDPNCEYVVASMEDIQNYYVSRGYTEYSELIPISDVVDETYMKEVLNRIGKYQE